MGDSRNISKNVLEKVSLARRAALDKVLHDLQKIAKNKKYNGYQRRHASIVYNFFDKSIRNRC